MQPALARQFGAVRLGVVAADLPAGVAQAEGDRPPDEPEPDDVDPRRGRGVIVGPDRSCERRGASRGAAIGGLRGRGTHHGAIVPAARGGDGEAAHLVGRQRPPLPRPQPAVAERTDARAHQARHRVADRLAHPPHLAVAAFVDDDAQHARRRLRHRGRGGAAVVEVDAVAQAADRARAHAAGPGDHLGEVLLVDAVARVGDAVGELAVVREHQQALGVGVEAADREDPRVGRHVVEHRPAPVRVLGGGHHPGRLVEQVVHEIGPRPDRCAVDLDQVVFGVDAATEPGDLAVDRHLSGGDQLLGGAAAAPAPARQDLLQPLARALGVAGGVTRCGHPTRAARPRGPPPRRRRG